VKKLICTSIALPLIWGWLDPEGIIASFFREYGVFELSWANVFIPIAASFIAILLLYKIFDSPKKCADKKPFFLFLILTPIISTGLVFLIGAVGDAEADPSKLEFVFAFIFTLIYFYSFIPLGRYIWSKGSLVHYPYFGKGA